jgi:CHASE2 domain-containing sensor protein
VAHEIVVNILAAVALGALAFVLLGGRVDDLYVRVRGSAPVSGEVTVVAIDEESFYLWNPYQPEPETTPRGLLAEIVRFLTAAGARVVVLDVLTDQPADGDEALVRAIQAHGRVVVAERFSPGRADGATPFAPASVCADVAVPGFANFGLEEQTLFSDELLVRSVPMVVQVARARLSGPFPVGLVGAFQDDGAPVPALSLAAAWLQRSQEPAGTLGRALASRCGGTPLQCTSNASVLGLPATPGLLHEGLPINFRGREGSDRIPAISAARVLRSLGESALARTLGLDLPLVVPDDIADRLRGKVVVVGRVDAGAKDHFVTPFAFPAMIDADMSGPRVHAQVIDTLLSGRHVRRYSGAWAWGAAAMAGCLVLVTGRRAGVGHLLCWVLLSSGLLAAGIAAFAMFDGLVLDVAPALALISCALVAVHLYARAAQGSS